MRLALVVCEPFIVSLSGICCDIPCFVLCCSVFVRTCSSLFTDYVACEDCIFVLEPVVVHIWYECYVCHLLLCSEPLFILRFVCFWRIFVTMVCQARYGCWCGFGCFGIIGVADICVIVWILSCVYQSELYYSVTILICYSLFLFVLTLSCFVLILSEIAVTYYLFVMTFCFFVLTFPVLLCVVCLILLFDIVCFVWHCISVLFGLLLRFATSFRLFLFVIFVRLVLEAFAFAWYYVQFWLVVFVCYICASAVKACALLAVVCCWFLVLACFILSVFCWSSVSCFDSLCLVVFCVTLYISFVGSSFSIAYCYDVRYYSVCV